ncbi:hypothetical protein K402DRAFT_451991 [Aulographum hederae CBS 113979]|uniref:Uncharacterized protein n=1 Tax=Aulographum hederae CBS 113979 TaxID=1176131 RepID=A0A6G1H9T8_9PEZI|nr:hypothetical protein K402DRAFT_451991 [Aulographum hederae CBS 113979]
MEVLIVLFMRHVDPRDFIVAVPVLFFVLEPELAIQIFLCLVGSHKSRPTAIEMPEPCIEEVHSRPSLFLDEAWGSELEELFSYFLSPDSSRTSSIMSNRTPSPMSRPPLSRGGSSASSVSSAGKPAPKPVPSFQDFMKNMPGAPKEQKALPSVPSKGPPPVDRRKTVKRSSSVHSRAGLWEGAAPWKSDDDEEDGSEDYILQPRRFSTSTPHLSKTQPMPPLLEARTYQPLLPDPSPASTPPRSPLPAHESLPLRYDDPEEGEKIWAPLPLQPPSPPPLNYPPLPIQRTQPIALDTSVGGGTVIRDFAPESPLSRFTGSPVSPNSHPSNVSSRSASTSTTHSRFSSHDKTLASLGLSDADSIMPSPGWAKTRGERGGNSLERRQHQDAYLERRQPAGQSSSRSRTRYAVDDEWEDSTSPVDLPAYAARDPEQQSFPNAAKGVYHEPPSSPNSPAFLLMHERLNNRAGSESSTDGRDIKLVPAPLFWDNRFKPNQVSQDDLLDIPDPETQSSKSKKASKAHKTKAGKKGAAAATGPLKMVLPTTIRRHDSSTGEIPISPPPVTPPEERARNQKLREMQDPNRFSAFYPRAQSPATSGRFKLRKRPKQVKKKTGEAEKSGMPLELVLPRSVNNSPRPSVERGSPRPSGSPRPAVQRAGSGNGLRNPPTTTTRSASPLVRDFAQPDTHTRKPSGAASQDAYDIQTTSPVSHPKFGTGYSFGYGRGAPVDTNHYPMMNTTGMRVGGPGFTGVVGAGPGSAPRKSSIEERTAQIQLNVDREFTDSARGSRHGSVSVASTNSSRGLYYPPTSSAGAGQMKDNMHRKSSSVESVKNALKAVRQRVSGVLDPDDENLTALGTTPLPGEVPSHPYSHVQPQTQPMMGMGYGPGPMQSNSTGDGLAVRGHNRGPSHASTTSGRSVLSTISTASASSPISPGPKPTFPNVDLPASPPSTSPIAAPGQGTLFPPPRRSESNPTKAPSVSTVNTTRSSDSFLSRALSGHTAARREKEMEKRRSEIKRSIRVVGQVDPRCVETKEGAYKRERVGGGDVGRDSTGASLGGKKETFGEGWV